MPIGRGGNSGEITPKSAYPWPDFAQSLRASRGPGQARHGARSARRRWLWIKALFQSTQLLFEAMRAVRVASVAW